MARTISNTKSCIYSAFRLIVLSVKKVGKYHQMLKIRVNLTRGFKKGVDGIFQLAVGPRLLQSLLAATADIQFYRLSW